MSQEPDYCLAELDPRRSGQELSMGSRTDQNGKLTYFVTTRDRKAGVLLEKIYDQERKLLQLKRRAPGSRSETTFDPNTGAVLQIFESMLLPDGNSLTKDIVYRQENRAEEAVIVVGPNGELVRRVERRHLGLRTVYQGQTEYRPDGAPATTVNHYMDESTGRLIRREQTQWQSEGQRLLSENFYFDQAGGLHKYTKVLYHAGAGPFIEETQVFDSQSQTLFKREVAAFDLSGKQTCLDVLTYDDDGDILERHSRFMDKDGREIAAL
jgi:hypothetical protein